MFFYLVLKKNIYFYQKLKKCKTLKNIAFLKK